MFYQAKQIKRLLNCSICNERFIDEIKCLPCGESICDYCSSKININETSREFKCQICNEMHFMPEKGLPNNVRLNKFLKLDEEKVSRGSEAEELTKSLNELENESEEFMFNLNKSKEQTIKDYCESLRIEIEISYDSAVEHLSRLKQTQLKQVNDYENELINNLKQNNDQEKEQEWLSFISEVNSFTKQCIDYLEQVKLDKKELIIANNRAFEMNNKLKEYQAELQSILFNKKLLQFELNGSFQNSNNYLGWINFYYISNKSKKKKT